MSTSREIRLREEDDGGWSAIDEKTGVASHGETREEALQNLDEAMELTLEVRREDTDAPTTLICCGQRVAKSRGG